MKSLFSHNILAKSFRGVFGILRPHHRKKIIGVIILIITGGALDVIGLASLVPIMQVVLNPELLYTNDLLNSVYTYFGFTSAGSFLLVALISLVLIFIIKNLTSLFIYHRNALFSTNVANDISEQQLKYYMQQDLDYINNHNSALLVRYAQVIPTFFSNYILLALLTFTSELIVVLIIITGIAIYNPQIFILLTCTLAPAFILVYRLIKNKVQKLENERNALSIQATRDAYHAINGYIDVKLLGKESFFTREFMSKQKILYGKGTKIFVLNQVPSKVIELITVVGVVIMLLYTLYSDNKESMIPLLTLYIAAAYRLMPSVNKMLIALVGIKSYEYVFDVIGEAAKSHRAERNNESTASAGIRFNNEIGINNLAFTYEGAFVPAIDHISFRIRKGEKIGIVGKSGSGKTTLMNVLLRFYNEQEGNITVDGTILDKANKAEWRKLIGYVKQNVFILDGDFIDNIAFGVSRDKVDKERLDFAIQLANLEDVIRKSPGGLETNIGENGTRLSGGQRQRIAIARALYRNAAILIFDEATSALDNETEQEITRAIDKISDNDRTIIIIAHRITTLKNCDVIYKMDNGKIVGEYTYNQLIEQTIL